MVSRPNDEQEQWREAIRSVGSVVSGGRAVIHHPVGRTGKHNKIDIGHWWLVPLTDGEHRALHTQGETFNHESRKAFEKWGYTRAAIAVAEKFPFDFQPPQDVHDAIMDYHR